MECNGDDSGGYGWLFGVCVVLGRLDMCFKVIFLFG